MLKNKNALLIFAKNPVIGKVKTRIGLVLGDEKALEIYRSLLDGTYCETKSLSQNKFLFLSDDPDKNLFDPCFEQRIQNGKELGEKMHNALDSVFRKGFKKVILIGTDVPGLKRDIINEAFDKLYYFDIVIGPAMDGGYYLIGMKEPDFSLFKNMEWGNEKVLSKTIKRIKEKAKSYYLLKKLNDIDTYEDLKLLNYKNDLLS